MSFAINGQSDSSSSGSEDDKSDSTGTESTSSCGPVLPAVDPLTLNGIGTINMESCQDSHIGPRIVTDNLNIILSHPQDIGLIERITRNYDKLDWEREIGRNTSAKNMVTEENLENPTFSWNYKRAPFSYIYALGTRKVIVILSLLFILVTIVVFLVVLFGRKPHDRKGNDTTVTTTTPWPITDHTDPARPITVPTDDGHTVKPTSMPLVGLLIGRSSWSGMQPPLKSAREPIMVKYIALDNLQGDHCSSVDICSAILQQREKAENESLNYNFLIDDSGNVYEARGWDYMSDYKFPNANPETTIKVAFIGDYTDSRLSQIQISSFQKYIHLDIYNVRSNSEVEAQCCRDLSNETGPSENVVCDMVNKIDFVLYKGNNCTKCEWGSGLNCHKKT